MPFDRYSSTCTVKLVESSDTLCQMGSLTIKGKEDLEGRFCFLFTLCTLLVILMNIF